MPRVGEFPSNSSNRWKSRNHDPDTGITLRQREQCFERRQETAGNRAGRLGRSLRRIEAAVHIRRETVANYLCSVGIPVQPPGGWARLDPAKSVIEVITDFGAALPPVTVLDGSRVPILRPACGSPMTVLIADEVDS
jgi:hypothetical protein